MKEKESNLETQLGSGNQVFDKKEFVESVIERGLNRNEIIKEAQAEIRLTESISHRVTGAPESRAAGSGEYLRFLGSVEFFLQSRKSPAVLSADNFRLLHRLAKHLVDRDNLSPDILELFGPRG